jgi:hypothetical protein
MHYAVTLPWVMLESNCQINDSAWQLIHPIQHSQNVLASDYNIATRATPERFSIFFQ